MTKTNTRSRIVSILLVLMMLLTMVPITGVTASAAEPEWTTVNSFEELKTAVKDKKEYIKLGQDINTRSMNSGMGMLDPDRLNFEGRNTVLDLNGNTLDLQTRFDKVYFFIYLKEGSLTIKDSSSAKTGKISGSFGSTTGGYDYRLIDVAKNGSLTLEDGTFSTIGHPYPDQTDVIYCRSGSVTVKAGVTISQPVFHDEGYAKELDGGGYALRTEGESTVIIDGGEFDGCVKLIGHQDANGSVQINGGTFKKDVQVMYAAEENNSDPAVTVNGGTFEGTVYLEYWPWKKSLYMPYRLNGGTFKGTVNLMSGCSTTLVWMSTSRNRESTAISPAPSFTSPSTAASPKANRKTSVPISNGARLKVLRKVRLYSNIRTSSATARVRTDSPKSSPKKPKQFALYMTAFSQATA